VSKVFADYHHGALYYSFHLLFEKRLGWELYRPTGYDWFKRGLWRYSAHPFVVKQYLEPPSDKYRRARGVYHVPLREGKNVYTHRAITLQAFEEMDFDYVVASVYQHEEPYRRLAEEKGAVFVRQLGNPQEFCNYAICRNVLCSITNPATPIPDDVNHVVYHQEFDLEDFRYEAPNHHNVIKSFVNCYPTLPDYHLWGEYRELLHDFKWFMHGGMGLDGLVPEEEKAEAMRQASFIWHLKPLAGYEHVIHNAYAVGRPCIVKMSYLRGSMPEPLLIDGETCTDLDRRTMRASAELIRRCSKPEVHVEMCERAHERFREVVDFDREFGEIRRFLRRAS